MDPLSSHSPPTRSPSRPPVNRSPAPSVREILRDFSILKSKPPPSNQDATSHSEESVESADGQVVYAWVKPVVLCALGSSLIAAINIILAIAALLQSRTKYSGSPATSGSLYEGSCSRSRGWVTGLHVLINILSTLLLGASNYCMQCLSAPSRADVDRAHAKRIWLDIGTPSLKNLRFVNRRRKTLWFILLATSTPIHLLYNSVVYSTLTTYEYPVLVAPASWDFQENPIENFVLPEEDECFEELSARTVSEAGQLLMDNKFERLSKQECIDYYAAEYISNRKTVVVLVNNLTKFPNPILPGGIGNEEELSSRFQRHRWMCEAIAGYENQDDLCDKNRIMGSLDTWSIFVAMDWLTGDDHPVFGTGDNGSRLFDTLNYTYLLEPDSPELMHDLDTLVSYIKSGPTMRGPTKPRLIQFLNNSTNWENSSWASSLDYYSSDSDCDNVSLVVPDREGIVENYTVDACLSERVEEECKLVFNLPIALVVIACSIVKVICMFLTAKENRTDIFLTIGDAVASFLTNPDPTTTNRCFMTKETVDKGTSPWQAPRRNKPVAAGSGPTRWKGYKILTWADSGKEPDAIPLNAYSAPVSVTPGILPGRKRWFQAVGWKRWAVVGFLAIGTLATAGGLLRMAISNVEEDRVRGIQGLWNLGFGRVNSTTMIHFQSSSTIGMLLLANTPQLLLSGIYFAYNSVLTAMALSAEYASHSDHRKPLRVSWPRGLQKSTYYLTLPYQYSIPLLSLSVALHWLLSQSIFYTRIELQYIRPRKAGGETSEFLSTCGYSPMALIFTILLGGLMTFGIVIMGMKRYPRVPLAANCSAAISAACHPPPGDERPALKPIMWGEVVMTTKESASPTGTEYIGSGSYFPVERNEPRDASASASQAEGSPRIGMRGTGDGYDDGRIRTAYSHCCFTSKEVVAPSPTKLYI